MLRKILHAMATMTVVLTFFHQLPQHVRHEVARTASNTAAELLRGAAHDVLEALNRAIA